VTIFFDVLRAISDMRAEDMPSAHRLVLLMVANHANATNRSWPSIGLLHEETGYGRTKIAEVLDELVAYGWLRPDGREGRGFRSSARYEVALGRPWPADSRAHLARPVERLRDARRDPPGEQRDPAAVARAAGCDDPPIVIRPAGDIDPPGGQRADAPEPAPVIRAAGNSDPPIVVRAADHCDPRGGQEPPRSLPEELPIEPPRDRAHEGSVSQTPDPPTPKKRPRTGRGSGKPTPIPEGWGATPGHFTLGASLGFDASRVKLEADNFVDRAHAKALQYIDWDAAFRTSLRNARQWADERGARGVRVPFRASTGHDFIQDEARPLDSDNWPEAQLVKHPERAPAPPPPPRPELTPELAKLRDELELLTPAQREARMQQAGRFWGAEVMR
jgi:hypothetical protein